MKLEKEDLFSLGYQEEDQENGGTVFYFDYDSCLSINLILLREVLKEWGDYKIIDKVEIEATRRHEAYVVCVTDLPWEMFVEEYNKTFAPEEEVGEEEEVEEETKEEPKPEEKI